MAAKTRDWRAMLELAARLLVEHTGEDTATDQPYISG